MLSREQAAEALKPYAAPGFPERGGAASPPARGLFSRFRSQHPLADELEQWLGPNPPNGEDDPSDRLAAQLDDLDAGPRTRVLTQVSPQLGPALARWWVWAQSAPYQQGWARRGFRSPWPQTTRAERMGQLRALVTLSRHWPQDPAWFAAWTSHLETECPDLAGLFASEIDAGNAAIADTLLASLLGRHPVSGATTTGIRALLGCADPARWEHVATVLRSAGRQEGLRFAVLQASDLAHPGAFARILDVVVTEDLTRFAGLVASAGVWFGEEIDIRSKTLPDALGELRDILVVPGEAQRSFQNLDAYLGAAGSPRQLFLRLWVLALHDALAAAAAGRHLLATQADPLMRRAAARLLAELGLPQARDALRAALADPDLGVYANAVSAWPASPFARDRDATLDEDMVELLLARVRTLGKEQRLDTGLVGVRIQAVSAAQAADVILAHRTLAAAPPEAVKAASSDGRYNAVLVLAQAPRDNRAALFGFFTDPSSAVRGAAIHSLQRLPSLTVDEAVLVEDSLRRKASDVRRAAVSLLLKQSGEQVRASVDRLRSGTADQARAATEIAKHAGIALPGGVAHRPSAPVVTVLGRELPAALVPRAAERTPAVRPPFAPRSWEPYQAGCRLVVTSLRAWLAEHADVEVQTSSDVTLLANVGWLPRIGPGQPMPLAEIFDPWWERIGAQLTDGGVELLLLSLATSRALAAGPGAWAQAASARIIGPIPAATPEPALVWPAIARLATHHHRASWADVALDAAQTLWSDLPVPGCSGPSRAMKARGREPHGGDVRDVFDELADLFSLADLTGPQLNRMWWLARFIDEPEGTLDVVSAETVEYSHQWGLSGTPKSYPVFDQPWRLRAPVELLARAAAAGYATRGDLLDALLELDQPYPRQEGFGRRRGRRDNAMHYLSGRRGPQWADTPVVTEVMDEVRAAAIGGEVVRGELTAPLTAIAQRIRSAAGVGTVIQLLTALGDRPFARAYAWTDSRESSLSKLIRKHFPAAGETARDLSAALTGTRISERRVIELAVYAPQWAVLVQEHLGWAGLESAVWWVHAHTKDDSWTVDHEIREEWTSAVAQRTPLDATDLTRGAADVAWFTDVIDTLGPDRFARVLAAAKYASTSGGHKRAELYANALLGRVDEDQLRERIRTKRHQDSVRALGLLPVSGRADALPSEPVVPDPVLLDRYQLLRGFVGSDRSSGSARRASETTAATIGLENLARAAGYRDPGRLTWAMEAAAVRDLAAGPIVAGDGSVTVTLSLTAAGTPDLSVVKNGKALKAIPAASAKHPDIAALKARVGELRAQARRMRASLEQSCVSGEQFTLAEIADLLAHPVLAPMLNTLVLVSAESVLGFPAPTFAHAPALIGPDGQLRPLDGSPVRIAHPVDLLACGEWPAWQRMTFASKTTQPFRQLFRELYVPTPAELDAAPVSRRYAGHQVEQRRAAGLFTSRGWVADFEAGFGRTFHAEKLTAWCGILATFGTPGAVEDATIEDVSFTAAGRWEPIPIGQVPPRLFSEVMRDLDLVVSLAHSGGVNPETSESTVQMRGRLVEETVDLLALGNVEVTDHHALIRGTLGRYSVHLGSAQVHRIPGHAICIIPVSAQHRGRVFLPFADDDPRTAEVISKVLLLARDDRIQDPTILGQLT